jgi:hypothetical protein
VQNRRLTAFLSIGLHTGFILLLFWYAPEKTKPKPVWIELADSQTAPPTPIQPLQKQSVSQKSARKISGNSKVDFSLHSAAKLMTKPLNASDGQLPDASRKMIGAVANDGDPMQSIEPEGAGWSKGVQYGQGMGLEFVNDTLGFFQAVHRKVDASLVYPDDFARARLEGKVHIEAVLSKDGRLLDFTATQADNDVLHAYALAYLVQVLKQPLPERAWLKTEKAIVDFDFEFRVRINGNIASSFVTGVQKNRLAFARENMVDPWLNEKVYEIFTHYVPPIVPLPGGFYVDLTMAYQFVKNLRENAPLESQARLARIKFLHSNLLQTIHAPDAKATPTAASGT